LIKEETEEEEYTLELLVNVCLGEEKLVAGVALVAPVPDGVDDRNGDGYVC